MHGIAKANIDRFNLLLETEADPTKRAMIMRLLAEEKMRLLAEEKARAESLARRAQILDAK